ncbi:mCG1041447, partial [Mus musculus]
IQCVSPFKDQCVAQVLVCLVFMNSWIRPRKELLC